MMRDNLTNQRFWLTIRLAAIGLVTSFASSASAVQLTWYGDGSTLGGNGTWDTVSPNWTADGVNFGAWNNSGSNGATFDFASGGIPGYVYIAEPVAAVNLTFNDTGFQLYSGSGTNSVTLLGASSIYVAAGSQATVSATLAGAAGLTLSGGGELVLGSSNSYSGTTTVSDSYLNLAAVGALPAGTLVIDGGVIELGAGNFTRSAGTAANQVRFTSNGGGFAAANSNCAVNLGGSSSTVTWGSSYFLPSSGSGSSATVVLGSPWAAGTIDFQNPISLGGANRTVQVNAGSGTVAVNAKLSGSLSGGGGLIVIGDGVLALSGSNSYSGGTTIADGVLSVQNPAALGSGGVSLDGGTLQLAVAPNGGNAVSLAVDSAIDVTGTTAGTLGTFAVGGNTLYVTGGASGANSAYSVTLGRTTLSGNPKFNVANNGIGVGTLTLGSLSDGGAARTLTKSGSGVLTLATSASSLGPGTTVNVSGGTLNCNAAASLGNYARVSVSHGTVLSLLASQQVSSLAGQGTVSLGENLLIVGNSDNQSSSFSGILSGTGGTLVKQGNGTLTLAGTDSYTGGTYVESGTLIAADREGLANGSSLTIGEPSLFPSAAVPVAVSLSTVTPVPEPTTLALLSIGLILLHSLRRRLRIVYKGGQQKHGSQCYDERPVATGGRNIYLLWHCKSMLHTWILSVRHTFLHSVK
jgi:autotransporter-associated beta strand protein